MTVCRALGPALSFVIGVLLCFVSGIVLLRYQRIVENGIKKELVLLEGTDIFSQWKNVQLPIYMKFYFFDVQNAEEVEYNGSKPILKEKGPYTFLEKQWKDIIGFDDANELVEFRRFKGFHFLRDKSVGPLTEEATVLNIPTVAAANGAMLESETSDMGMAIVEVVAAVIKELEEPLFEVHTIDEMLFGGYQVAFLERMKEIASGFGMDVPDKLPNNTFGLMVGKNGTDCGVLKVHTGINGDVFKVHSWEGKRLGKREVNYWNGTRCNAIVGSDGTGFGPGVTRDQKLFVFDPEFCRSAHVVYKEDSSVFGIHTLRFVIPDTMFKASLNPDYPENECYCAQWQKRRDICEVDGYLDMSSCSDGAPIVMSQVHFMDASPVLQNGVIGLTPNVARDQKQAFIDIEPITGAVLNAARRIQINVRIKQNAEFPPVANVRDVVLPILWLEESAGIDEKIGAEFKANLAKISTGKSILQGVLVLGMALIGIAIAAQKMAKKQDENA